MNTSNICKTKAPELPSQDWRYPNRPADLRTREHRCFWACVLGHRWTRVQLSCFGTLNGASVGYKFGCSLWEFIKGPDVSAERLQFFLGKLREQHLSWSLWRWLCDLVIVPFISTSLSFFLIMWPSFLFLPSPHLPPQKDLLGFACIIFHFTNSQWKMVERRIWTCVWCPILDVKIVIQ